PVAIAVYVLVQRRRTRYAVRFTNVDLLSNIAPRTPAWRRHVPPALYLLAIASLAFALARPSMTVAVPRDEATVILAIDVSGSMSATDVDPTRLAAAQKAAASFVDELPARFRVGLVAFSSGAHVVVAPTTDRTAIHDGLDSLRAGGGTAIGDAIITSLQAAGLEQATQPGATPSPSPSASPSAGRASPGASGSPAPSGSAGGSATQPIVATVLLSDGASTLGRDPLTAATQAAALNVPVYTIALGTQDGTIQLPNQFGQLEEVPVPPDPETLAAIAETTNAKSFQAPTSGDLAQIYQSLGSKVGWIDQQQEVTQAFAAAALAFVIAGAGLAAHWFNRFP
ncbi:MAG TPA: VWA domain-containing protein, partial [Candidatus Limnocylindrales bacterium]|nr:VWA domain-containing protein [Candidatus Limnocylindrales bacterium]